MNDPDENGQCLLVMATSVKTGRKADDACILTAGCHSFVTHPTFMLYRMASFTSTIHIGKMVDTKYYTQKSDVSQAVYVKVRDGLYSSENTPQGILAYAKKQKI